MSDVNISASGDRITVRGKGIPFLKLKSNLAKRLPDGEILPVGRGHFSISSQFAYLLEEVLKVGKVEIDDATGEMVIRTSRLRMNHKLGIDRIREVLEKGLSETMSSYWNEILDVHQGVAVNCSTVPGLQGLCLFDEQGTGKTLMSVASFDILKESDEVDIMIIAGPKSLLTSWKGEFERFLPAKYKLVRVDGTISQRYRRLQETGDVFMMTYEGIASSLTQLKALAKSKRLLLVADESFFVKNSEAVRSVAVRDFRRFCVRALVLCGTPAPNRAEDIVHQFDVADNGYTFENFIIPKDKNEAYTAIKNRIEERGAYLRRTKSEVLPGLPPKKFNIVKVHMSGRQKFLYEKARTELELYLKSLDNQTFRRNLTTYFQKRAALLQICVDPSLIDPLSEESAKYVILDKLLEKLVKHEGRKVVVWSVYTKTLDAIEKRYSSYGLVRIDGTVVSAVERGDAVERFQNDPNVRVFIGNPAAAGAGITLHSAADSVYLSFSNQAAVYLQSIDRIHRRGQQAEMVNYYVLLCSDTLEEGEFERLRAKEKDQMSLLSDPEEEHLTLELALEELIGKP